MDAGEYETNTLLITNIASIAFKIYEPVATHPSAYTFAVSDVEAALRNGGHLVHADPLRRAIWCFRLVGKDDSSIGSPATPALESTIDVCGYRIGLVDEGAFEPASLSKNRPAPGANPLNTPSSTASSASAVDNKQSLNTPSSSISSSVAQDGDQKPTSSAASDQKGHSGISVKDMYEYFISAVLSSLSCLFCSKVGAIPLNARSLLLPREPALAGGDSFHAHAAETIATFRVYMTTTGSLLTTLFFSRVHGLASAADNSPASLLSPGMAILAAPLGMFGTFQGGADAADYPSVAGSAVASPDTQFTRFRPEADARNVHWRNACSKMLELRGIPSSLLSKSPWLSIQALRRKPLEQKSDGKRTPLMASPSCIVWPSILCFGKLTRHLSRRHRAIGDSDARPESFDVLGGAKSWYLGAEERDEALEKRKKEREATSAQDPAEGESRAPVNEYSPLALRRPSNPGVAAGAMYPTPPDGIQNLVGATPSLDGTVSSPGAQAPTAALVDIDVAMTGSSHPTEAYANGWDAAEMKREQPNSSFLIQGDNLFGDIGDDMFGEASITDADFNFFDEQPGPLDVNLSHFPDVSSVMEPSADASQTFAQFSQKPSDTPDVKMADAPASPVFAKPELKHARSTLAEENRQRDRPMVRASATGTKRQPSPFNPDTVYKRIKASLSPLSSGCASEPPARRGSIFDKVDFDPSFSLLNKKYQDSGRFDVQWDSQKENHDKKTADSAVVPTTDYLRRHSKGRANLKDLPSNMGVLIARITGDLENSSLHQSPGKLDEPTSDADEMSLVSDQDDSSDFSDEPSSPTKSSVVRRRRLDDDRMSVATSIKDLDVGSDSPAYSSVDLAKFAGQDTPELSLTDYFAELEPLPCQLSLADDDFIMVAQIVTEQVVGGCLRLGHAGEDAEVESKIEDRRELAGRIRSSIRTLKSILPRALEGASECQLRPLIEVADVPLLGQPTRMQPRPGVGTEIVRPNLFQIPTPHVEVRRHESQLSVLPSALGFWESLGLGPAQGPKDIHSICMFPNWEGMADSAGIFLDRLRSVYESLKLGNFERTPSSGSIADGLVPVDANETCKSPSWMATRLNQIAKLAHALMSLPLVGRNFVVYAVYMPGDPSTIVEACTAFQRLFQMYKQALADRKKPAQNELVLQLVPTDYIATATSLAIPPPSDYVRLCLETYDRCTLFGGPMPAAAIVLEPPLPRMIEFRLTTSPPTNLLQDNTCIHIAYAQSVDERWVTAAWTDNRGNKQMTASYCLGRKAKPLSTPLADVAHEIWETTHDLISMWKVHWRIIITKCGPMDQQEIDFWIALSQTESKASVSLTLLTVDTNPSLQLIPPAVKIPPQVQLALSGTPVSTPQASIVSPEQSGTPMTPMGAAATATVTTPGGGGGGGGGDASADPDPDATLVDVTDTTWGAVVSHRLNNSASLVDLCPALVSGYLVKRGGTRPEDPPVVMEVNILHSEGHARLYEALLREMLTYFRGLGTLARSRGVVDRETDVRPWHVAAAEKGVQALYQLL